MDIATAREFGAIGRRSRPELVEALQARFPASKGEVGAAINLPVRGGRESAVRLLAAIDPLAYGKTRNHVAGAVTRLSPWIRHGVLDLAEVRDAALTLVRRPEDAEKLVSELAWRDYWREVHSRLGDAIQSDLEGPAEMPRRPPAAEMPADVLAAETGMACIDDFVSRLHASGWLHNHERMWLASWLVHARGVRWQAGAAWFLSHLLDGDPASNHLSWQWVAGTFAARPYIFNRENLETFTSAVHCRDCRLAGRCDLEGTYDDLSARFFLGPAADRSPLPGILRGRLDRAFLPAVPRPPTRPLVWIGRGSASPTGPALSRFPDSPRLFVLDPHWLETERPALKRLVFLWECLADIPDLLLVAGNPAELLPAAAAALGCDGIALAWTPCPRDRGQARVIAASLPTVVVDEPPLCDRSRVDDLRRFSRYWQRVRDSALHPRHA